MPEHFLTPAGHPAAAATKLRSVLLLCYHYPPSKEVGGKRVLALAKFLAARDIAVTIVTGSVGAIPPSEFDDRITVRQIADPKPLAIGLLVNGKRRMRSFLFFRKGIDRPEGTTGNTAHASSAPQESALGLKHWFFRFVHVVDDHKKWAWITARRTVEIGHERAVDLIWASGPPMSGLLAAANAAKRLNCPLIMDLRDPWLYPGNPPLLRMEARVARRLERFVVKQAAAIVSTSPGLTMALQARYPDKSDRIHTVMNGFDGQPAARSTDTQGRLRIVFAGALYYNRDPFPFFAALDELLGTPGVDASKVEVIFVGECDSYKGRDLKTALAGTRSGQVVQIRPPVAASEVARIYEQATVLLNFAQGQLIQVPAKTFEQLTAGRELLIICEAQSDTARIARQIPGVRVVVPGDQAGLRGALEDLYRRHVTEGTLTPPDLTGIAQFSRDSQNEKLLEIFRSPLK